MQYLKSQNKLYSQTYVKMLLHWLFQLLCVVLIPLHMHYFAKSLNWWGLKILLYVAKFMNTYLLTIHFEEICGFSKSVK